MKIHNLTSTDGFVVVDLADAPRSSGVVRLAKKILVDGAVNLARERTYTYAALSIVAGGASAGVNAEPPAAVDALDAFVAELRDQASSGSLRLEPGKGIPDGAVDDLSAHPPVDPHEAIAASAAAAAGAAGSLDGVLVAIDTAGDSAAAVSSAFENLGARCQMVSLDDSPTGDVDVVCVGSKAGVFDHDAAERWSPAIVVPIAPVAVSAKGLATASRLGSVVVPGFISMAGPVIAEDESVSVSGVDDLATAIERRVTPLMAAALGTADGAFLSACLDAERFLATWTDEQPFGRPLA